MRLPVAVVGAQHGLVLVGQPTPLLLRLAADEARPAPRRARAPSRRPRARWPRTSGRLLGEHVHALQRRHLVEDRVGPPRRVPARMLPTSCWPSHDSQAESRLRRDVASVAILSGRRSRGCSRRRACRLALRGAARRACSLARRGAGARGSLEAPARRALAYVTETATSRRTVWLAAASGSEREAARPGRCSRCSRPTGSRSRRRCSAPTPATRNAAPRSASTPRSARRRSRLPRASKPRPPRRWRGRPTRATWRCAQQSTAVTEIAAGSGLDVIDTQTGAVDVDRRTARSTARASRATAATGSCSRWRARSNSSAPANLYVSEPDGAGLQRLTSDGRSLYPGVGAARTSPTTASACATSSPEYQIWLSAPSGGAPVRRLTHIPVELARRRASCRSRSPPTAAACSPSSRARTRATRATVNVASGHARRVTVRGAARSMGAGISSDGSTLLIDEDALEEPPSHAAHRDDPVRRRALEGARRARLAGQLERLMPDSRVRAPAIARAIASAPPQRQRHKDPPWPRSR